MDMRIIKVIDTRDKMEVAGYNGKTRLVGIPGTGEERPCDLCGSLHEIHVYVELDDKTEMVVGQGCGNKTWGTFAKEMKSYLDFQELQTLDSELGYKFISDKIHHAYKFKDWHFEINGQKFNVCGLTFKTEKNAVMYIVKKKFKNLNKKFLRYFHLKEKTK